MNYNYARYFSSPSNYRGVERFISTPSSRLFSATEEHILYWMEVETDRNDCAGLGACWVQAGLGMGHTGYATANYLQAYFENSGPGTFYLVGYFPSIALTQNTFYNVFFSGTEADGHQRWQTTAGTSFMSYGWTWDLDNKIGVAAEMYSSAAIGDHCPRIDTDPNGFVNFGTTGFGGLNTSYGLANSFNGTTWSLWTGAILPPTENYEFHLLASNYAFNSRGGGD